MTKPRFLIITIVLSALFWTHVHAQDRGGRGDRSYGDRSSGDRGGFGGGSPWGGGSPRGGGGGSPWGGGGPTGGGGEDRTSRFASMLDRNGDGLIDQEEIDQMPEFFRNMMESRGVELRAGMSLDEMRETVRSGFNRNNEDGSDPRSAEARRRNAGPQPFRQKEAQRITVDLPPRYSELDLDFDGQLAFHEWLAARRDDIEEFDLIDADGDGFLTPQELLDYEAGVVDRAAQALIAGVQSSKLVIVGPPPTSRRDGRDARGELDPRASQDPRDRQDLRDRQDSRSNDGRSNDWRGSRDSRGGDSRDTRTFGGRDWRDPRAASAGGDWREARGGFGGEARGGFDRSRFGRDAGQNSGAGSPRMMMGR